jgi:hypothetical protein
MRAAQLCGMPTARVSWQPIVRACLVERHDRTMEPDGTLKRLWQADFCQLSGLPSDTKYEADGDKRRRRRRHLHHRRHRNSHPHRHRNLHWQLNRRPTAVTKYGGINPGAIVLGERIERFGASRTCRHIVNVSRIMAARRVQPPAEQRIEVIKHYRQVHRHNSDPCNRKDAECSSRLSCRSTLLTGLKLLFSVMASPHFGLLQDGAGCFCSAWTRTDHNTPAISSTMAAISSVRGIRCW